MHSHRLENLSCNIFYVCSDRYSSNLESMACQLPNKKILRFIKITAAYVDANRTSSTCLFIFELVTNSFLFDTK